MTADDTLEDIHDRILRGFRDYSLVVVNVIASASLNELLRGVAALVGPCSLVRLEAEPLGPQSTHILATAWSTDRAVVLGCRPSQSFPMMLLCAYRDALRQPPTTEFGFPLADSSGHLRNLVILLLKDALHTPHYFREAGCYIPIGEHEVTALTCVGREDDSGVQRIGTQ